MKKILICLVCIIIAFLISLSVYFFPKRYLKMYDVSTIYSERECMGLFWRIITDENTKEIIEEKHEINIPDNDYDKYYLLISDGREIQSIQYTNISRYLWQYDVPKGIEVFTGDVHKHEMFCYRIEKKLLKQDGD